MNLCRVLGHKWPWWGQTPRLSIRERGAGPATQEGPQDTEFLVKCKRDGCPAERWQK